jgi:hypothetical protein
MDVVTDAPTPAAKRTRATTSRRTTATKTALATDDVAPVVEGEAPAVPKRRVTRKKADVAG